MDVCREAVLLYGKEAQIGMLLEEMGELISALNRRLMRGRVDKATVEEELADVEVCLRQMRHVFPDDVIDMWVAIKLHRLEKKILKDRESGLKKRCFMGTV